jgi:hypothetical protein
MKRGGGIYRWQIAVALALLLSTVAIFALQLYFFQDPRDTFFYLLQDLAFLPAQVLLVTLVLNRLLAARERQAMLGKMNMVIGAFFAEAGSDLLRLLLAFDARPERLKASLGDLAAWPGDRFTAAPTHLAAGSLAADARLGSLPVLKEFLVGRRDFLLRLLENPNLLEHEEFTELLWAVFHLTDELDHRTDLTRLPESDLDHLSGDINRAYRVLVVEWLAYLGHLKRDYPYLFSLAARTNPFDDDARVEVA